MYMPIYKFNLVKTMQVNLSSVNCIWKFTWKCYIPVVIDKLSCYTDKTLLLVNLVFDSYQ